jgi:branched-subunit amino acid aminotransferase/4-amino-4-deoxychorismate lyase
MKINSKDIFVKNLNNYNEIILVGSGKGVVSVSEIKNTSWKRKSLEIYNRLIEIYNNEIFYS